MIESTYTVNGMTCEHCVASVTEEVGKIKDVTEVTVNLATGAVKVRSQNPVDDDKIHTAIEEAGYAITA